MRSGDTSIVLESWMKLFRWRIFLCSSGWATCCFIHLIDQGSIVFFQEQEDISSFRGVGGEGIGLETGIVGSSFFLTEGANFSCFFEWGNIFTWGVGRFTWISLVSVSSSARMAYLLFNDLGSTVGRLVSTVQTENPNRSPSLLAPSWLAESQTYHYWFPVRWKSCHESDSGGEGDGPGTAMVSCKHGIYWNNQRLRPT